MNALLKYILFPLAALFFLAGSVTLTGQNPSSNGGLRLKTVVIDAGHGGKDAGAISKDRKTYEKNLTLSIAKQFGKKIEDAYPDVKVIYTRTTDVFVELNERAAIANRNKADLFISVHINANNSASPSGFSAHILGQSSQANRDLFSANLELSKRENEVILLEEDYDTKYQGYDPQDPESMIFFNLMQNAYYEQSILFAADVTEALNGGPIKNNRGISQNPFLVLWRTTMPAVLLELGFISNDADLKVLTSSSGQDQIATRLFNAFKAFKEGYDGSVDYRRDVASASGDNTDSPNSGTAVSEENSSSSDNVSASSDESGETRGLTYKSKKNQRKQAENAASEESGSASGNNGKASSASGSNSVSGGGARYGIQIMTLSRELSQSDPALKGYKAEVFYDGKVYRYVVEVSDDENEVREKISSVQKKFSDAYLVKIDNGVPSKI